MSDPDASNPRAEPLLAGSAEAPVVQSAQPPSTSRSAPSAVAWVHNRDSKHCMQCHASFQAFRRRRHHCRKCGRLVCSSCASYWQLVPEYHANKPQRVCISCHSAVRQSREAADLSKLEAGRNRTAELHKIGRRVTQVDQLAGPIPCYFDSKIVWGHLHVRVVEAEGLIAADACGLSDPYCLLSIAGSPAVKTQYISQSLNPKWDALFVFEMCSPDAVLQIEIFDYDVGKSNDKIGYVDLPLDELHATDQPFSGWTRVTPPTGRDTSAGAIHLEVQLKDVCTWNHFLSHIRPPEVPVPPNEFDIDAVYGPAMYLVDTLWKGFGEKALERVMCILTWEYPVASLVVFVAWNAAAPYVSHWPTVLPLSVVMYSVCVRIPSVKVIRPVTEPAAVDADADEARLSFTMHEMFRMLPSSFKSFLMDVLQPNLRLAADYVHLGHTVLHKPGYLGYLVLGYVAWAMFWEACLHWIPNLASLLVGLIGSGILIAISPIMTAILGLVSYAKWMAAGSDIPSSWEFSSANDQSWNAPAEVRALTKFRNVMQNLNVLKQFRR